jgi:large repetitive protein
MGVAFSVFASFAAAASRALVFRTRRMLRLAIVAVVVLGALSGPAASRALAASGSTLFVQSFSNNTVNSAYPVSLPALPSGGTNPACLTASGNSTSGPPYSCPANNDSNGSGKLRLTTASTGLEGGVFATASVPTSQGIDATFNTYQYGGSGADGLAFVLAAVNPADPLSPSTMGPTGGDLGYSANFTTGQAGLTDGYMGIGLDVFGNYSNSVYEGSGCTNPAYISTNGKVPGQVVIRGPGAGTVGYCAINSTATKTSSAALTLRATTRAASVVPMEVVINPTAVSFTTASGITVPAGNYAVRFTPVGGSAMTETGTLPTVPSGLYPSSSWTTSAGIPKQLAFGWVGSTGSVTDFHEVDAANVVSFNPVPQLAVSQTSYVVASPSAGTPVTYVVSPSVSSSGASESNPISVTETLPAGVVPVGAYGSGWTCAAPSGQTITCAYSATPIAPGTSLPTITVQGIVTSSSLTADAIRSGTTVTASSSDGNPGIATSAPAGALPTAPSGVTLSPASGTISGGNTVTISGSNITGATAIEIGTTAQQQAGTSAVLLPCPGAAAAGCFTVSGSTLVISSMPSVPASETANVTVVTLGASGAASYVYTSTPGTPAAPTATAGITSATVSWTAPAANGSPITGYVVTPYLNGTAQTAQTFNSTATTQTLTGLTAGASYTFTVAAINAVGTGSASAQSNAVVPYTLPGAPAIGTATAGDSAATVSWTAPAGNGGSAITGYVVTPYIAGVAQTARTFSSTATTETVTGLTPGTSYTFKVAAVNAAGTGPQSAASAAVTVNAGPSLTFAAPPAGEAGVAYSDQLTATGGTGTLTWSVSSGTLPAGLTLSSTGLLSGTPTAAGSFPVTITVTDTTGGTASKAVTLVIAAAPSLANPTPPSAQAGVAYSDPLAVTGGTGPFTWLATGSLPPGITLNSATGVLSGTPTAAGLYSFTVQVTDSFGQTATQGLSVSVAVGQLVISASASSSTATQGGVVHYTITATNTGTAAYSGVTYSVPLANVLDDAAYNGDAAASSGTASVSGQTLTWAGNLAAGATTTVTFSVTVNNPYTGNGTLSFTVASTTVGTNCPAGSTDTRCTASVLVSALTIAATSGVTTAVPGAVVHYTVTVTNSGVVAYTGATFTDPLTGVLDDAAYNSDAAATAGTVSYTSPNLTWTGNLAAGATATITFSVTINNPDTGNKVLTSTITSSTTGTNCPTGGTDPRCTATVAVQGLTITSSANASSTTPGSTVAYTITVANTGQASYNRASITDSLTGVLDDATYNGDATASSGSLSYTSPNMTWSGSLAAGATATITFSVTVNNPDTGDKTLVTAVTSPTAASNCPASGPAPACGTSVTVLVPGLTIINSAGVASATPGVTVPYTVTITNTGQTPYTGITVTDDITGVLDDAVYNGDASATAGTVSYTSPDLTWTGSLAVGAAATVTFSVTVNNPDTGDRSLRSLATTVSSAAPGSNCAPGSTDARCSTSLPVLIPGLDLRVTANSASAAPGATVSYTIVADNTGQTTDTGVSFTDSLSGVLDDAVYNNNAAASTGTVSYTSPDLTWTGTLAAGAVATITFSVTVNNPDTGDKTLTSTLTSTATGSNCPAGSTGPSCSSAVTVSQLVITNTAGTASATPGSVVRFTATFANAGKTPYNDITISTNAADVFDDAVPNGDQTATSGTILINGNAVVWTGDIPVGGTVTVTGTVTVDNPDAGNHALASTITTAAAGSNCPTASPAAACSISVPVLTPGLSISNTPSTTAAAPGDTVGYTLTITDSGQTSYSGISVTDDLSGLADDAAYNGDAAATAGTVSYSAPTLTWTGSLSPGDSATVTFSATVNNPETGDKVLIVTGSSAAPGSSCPAGTTTAPCRSTAVVLTPDPIIIASASSATAVPGATVDYTVTITDSGQTSYTGMTVTDDLGGLLDDAVYNGDGAATTGTVSFASPDLTWTGNLSPGDSATVTFSATVDNPDTGDRVLATQLTSAAAGNNCTAGSTDPNCATSVPVESAALLTFQVTSGAPSTVAGGVVQYTVTVTNAAATAYTGAAFSDDLTDVLDDAVYNGDAAASTGTLSYTSPDLTWTGTVPASGTATITFSVTVNNPDTDNEILTNALTSASTGSNCAAGNTDARCSITVTVSKLVITNTAGVASATPGSVVRFTATFANAGKTPYNDITISTNAADVFDDAVPNGDQTATSGTILINGNAVVWTGDIPVGGTVTVTGTVTVDNPDAGNHALASTITTAAAGSNCPTASPAAACSISVPVLTPGLSISNTPSTTAAAPGDTVGYTLTITDSGQTSYSGISVTDDLSGLADDAAYNNDAVATTGTVSYAAPVLTWAGSLSPGDIVTVTFSVTVNNPDTGDKVVAVTAASDAPGSSCPAGTTSAPCGSLVAVLTPELSILSTAGSATAVPGGTVDYTVTITDSGQTTYTGISVSDDLSGVLDDAAYNGDGAASTGTVSFASPDLSWTGTLNPGDVATVTFSATVNNPDTGDKTLSTLISSTATNSNCASGSTDPNCVTSVPVAVLTMTNTASTATTTPGSTITYTITVANSGQVPLSGINFTIPLTGVLDDASYNNDAGATEGNVSFASPDLTYDGDLDPGQSAVITYTVTVNNPDTGDKTLTSTLTSTTPGSSCPPAATPAACTATVTVLVPALTITQAASVSTTTPGSAVSYTITVDNTGQTPYTGATVTDNLSSIQDDAAYNGDAAATSGTVTYTSPVLTWTGNLSPGDTAVITFTATVNNPDMGDKHLNNTVTSTDAGSTCPPSGPAPACSTAVTDLIPSLRITQAASVSTTTPGSAVSYTITLRDTGQTSYTGATVTDDLTSVLDDAAYNANATATVGTVSYTAPTLTWTGNLSPGVTATITYSVTVNNPETGNDTLVNTVTSTAAGSTCPVTGTLGSGCSVTVGIIAGPLSITAPGSAALGAAAPGGVATGSLGQVQVTDDRGFGADWAATVSSTNFTTDGGSPAETIPAGDVTYGISSPVTTGQATFTNTSTLTLSGDPQAVAGTTSVDGNTTDTWDPTIQVAVPAGAVGGTYTATITHSVS